MIVSHILSLHEEEKSLSNFKGSCQFFERRVFPVHEVGAILIAILGEPIKPRQQVGNCGRRIRIFICSPSLHDKTSKPQIQQQGAQGNLRGTFCCSVCYALPITRQNATYPVGRSHCGRRNVAVTDLRHLAWRHWRGEACPASAVLESCRFLFLLAWFFKIRTRIIHFMRMLSIWDRL